MNIITESLEFIYVGNADEDFFDPDGYSIAEKAYSIAEKSGIHISNSKELTYVAMEDDAVVGALWSSVLYDDDYIVYSFDVAVDPEYRNKMIGPRLINMALDEYRSLLDMGVAIIRVDVVNPKLVRYLQKIGFDVENKYGHHTIMIYRESN